MYVERFSKPSKPSRCNVLIFPEHVDGMAALLHWIEGFEAAGKGRVPGAFELLMHLRSWDLKEIEAQEETDA